MSLSEQDMSDVIANIVGDYDGPGLQGDLAQIVARHVAAALGNAAAEIESAFEAWDSLGDGPRAPHPLHSEAWLVERSYAICADIVRAQIHN